MQYDLATSISVRYPTVQRCNLESEVAKSTMAVYQVGLVEVVEASHAGARQGPRLVTTKSRWDKSRRKSKLVSSMYTAPSSAKVE
jgi:hypothetical protein